MKSTVIVIGAGVGGMTAAIRLRKAGFNVRMLEARPEPGGLASGVQYEGFLFDAGPYILLDREGLEWAFEHIGLHLESEVPLLLIDDIYQVESPGRSPIRFYSDLEKTADGFEAHWPGSGRKYREFVGKMEAAARSLRPLLKSTPNPLRILRGGAWMHLPLLMKPLASVLRSADLPTQVSEAIAIWTHVAGQTTNEAPGPLAFVPALMHTAGAYYPREGIRQIPRVLARAAEEVGVNVQYSTRVQRICTENGRVLGVDTDGGEHIDAAAVLSNSAALSTHLQLLDHPSPEAQRLKQLPLQSPGVCAYLAAQGSASSFYLRFRLDGNHERCRLLIQPSVLGTRESRTGWAPVRLLAPMDYRMAEAAGHAGQLDYLDSLIDEAWWKANFSSVRVLAKRTAHNWGREYNLYANSMNPVMTSRFMRQGRVAHRSPHVRGLYLAGSSTHPGQWVSFCAISGILAADCLIEDFQ